MSWQWWLLGYLVCGALFAIYDLSRPRELLKTSSIVEGAYDQTGQPLSDHDVRRLHRMTAMLSAAMDLLFWPLRGVGAIVRWRRGRRDD